MLDVRQQVAADGFAIVPVCLDEETVEALGRRFHETGRSRRDLLAMPSIRRLARCETVRAAVEAVLGPDCFAVKGFLFNKSQDANWKVPWHQDVTIAVRDRRDLAGFGPWTRKGGVWHVQPPAGVMSRLLAIRLHLDDSGTDNGPLRVIAGSHNRGRLSAGQLASLTQRQAVTCLVPRGGALLMRPLLVHGSSPCSRPAPRRVIHLEFSTGDLPGGLEWHDRVASG
jgi:ectoine hydroxylase-related dioxygenase (phytanoyl-CoA dioxygenase family)